MRPTEQDGPEGGGESLRLSNGSEADLAGWTFSSDKRNVAAESGAPGSD
jgi:hypothetical protein